MQLFLMHAVTAKHDTGYEVDGPSDADRQQQSKSLREREAPICSAHGGQTSNTIEDHMTRISFRAPYVRTPTGNCKAQLAARVHVEDSLGHC